MFGKKKYNIDFESASKRLNGVVKRTALELNENLSKKYKAKIYLKREDLQVVRSFKLRGAYNKISGLSEAKQKAGVVCASAGNHAQGFAHSCNILKINGVVFMPAITPNQKIRQTRMFGGKYVEVVLIGDTYDECAMEAKKYAKENKKTLIPPFDDLEVIAGQGTVGLEILEDLEKFGDVKADFFFIPIGGGGLCSGVGTIFKDKSPKTKIVGVEPAGAPAMLESFKAKKPITLEKIDTFVDGASVKTVGENTFNICKQVVDDLILVDEGQICTTILDLYNSEAIVAEPAGAMSIAALEQYADEIKGKTVICIVCGGNNDIDRMAEIKERSQRFEGVKHYFLVQFPQRAGALKEFVNDVLGDEDDITRFEYMKKNAKETGPALIGVLLKNPKDYNPLLKRMKKAGIKCTELNKDDNLFGYLV